MLRDRITVCCTFIPLIYFRCTWVKIDGDEYKLSSGVILEVKDDLPIIGAIQDIFLLNERFIDIQIR